MMEDEVREEGAVEEAEPTADDLADTSEEETAEDTSEEETSEEEEGGEEEI